VNLSVMPRLARRVAARTWRHAGREAGFTLIEAVMAMAIFAAVATALAGVLTSSISARSTASERTAAEQIANNQLEWIRSLDYDDVGLTVDGNPPGVVDANGNQSAQGGPTVPPLFTVRIDISWVDDSVPTSYDTKASYKNVVVKVSRARDSKQLTEQSTQVGPRQRAAFGGINKGIVNVRVEGYPPENTPFPDVLVRLNNGPSSPLADTTDAAGTVRFPGLDPATGSAYYDLVVPSFNGYILLPPNDPTVMHFQLAAGASPLLKVLQVYKPVSFTAAFNNSSGTPFVGTVVFTVANSRGSKSYTYTGTPINVTTITNSTTGAAELLVPATYTITVTNQQAAGFFTDVVTQDVPGTLSDYPNDLDATPTVTADPLGSISATVTSAGGPVVGATVTVSGGPRSIATQTATTNASGIIPAFSGLPAGSGYTVTAAKGGWSAPNQSVSVIGGSMNNLSFVFPTGSLKAVVTWATVPVANAAVSLTGGPGAISLSGTSDVNGEVLFSNVPAGLGYTMNAVKSSQTGSVSPTVVGATTTTVPVAMPTVSLVATVTWVGANVTGATVTLSGGPMSLSPISATTTGTGQVTFSNVPTSTNVPAGTGYTLAATKNGQTTTLTNQTVATSPTTSIGIALPTGIITATATWAGQPAGSAAVTISGGPNSPTTYTGPTNGSGVASITVPTTTSTYQYTVSVAKNTGTGSASVSTVTPSPAVPVSVSLTQTKVLTVTVPTNASVSITGGPNGTAGSLPKYTGATTSGTTVNITVPMATGYTYTVRANKTGCSGSGNKSGVNTVSSAATPTTVAVTYTTTACPGPTP
jgi:type II secretory pathway pseudopilin PulG